MGYLKLQRMQDSAYWWQFCLGIVVIRGTLSHKIPKYTITNAIYFDWRDPEFYGLEMSLSNILLISLLRSNKKDGNFS